jgi:preprotein translocase subunit YajC
MDLFGLTLLAQAAGGKPTYDEPMGGFVLPIILVVAFVYFFMIRPQKREQEAKEKLLGGLKKNDRVVTTGGMYGTIVNIKDDEITLRVDDQMKVKIRFMKSAISRVAGDPGATEAKKS